MGHAYFLIIPTMNHYCGSWYSLHTNQHYFNAVINIGVYVHTSSVVAYWLFLLVVSANSNYMETKVRFWNAYMLFYAAKDRSRTTAGPIPQIKTPQDKTAPGLVNVIIEVTSYYVLQSSHISFISSNGGRWLESVNCSSTERREKRNVFTGNATTDKTKCKFVCVCVCL